MAARRQSLARHGWALGGGNVLAWAAAYALWKLRVERRWKGAAGGA